MNGRAHLVKSIGLYLAGVLLLLGACVATAQSNAADEDRAKKREAEKDAMPEVDFVLTHNLNDKGIGPQKEIRKAKGWKEGDFTERGAVRVEGDTVYIGIGNDMSGISWRGPVAKMNYEISLDAKRVDGHDFFCGLTFPYGDDPCSFIVGGWGGTCVGISSVDYYDAYNNETARFRDFETDRWYHIRVRVTPDKIQAWIDDDQLVDLDTVGRKIGIRWEVEPSVPLGISTWRTAAAIRNVKLMAFAPPEPRTERKKP